MKLYIGNCSQQVQDFQYRLPENPQVRKVPIEIGRQVQIPGDLRQVDVDAIVEQHAVYGMIEVGEIDRSRDYNGLCYSVDKPIQVEKVRRALEHNTSVLIERGHATRQAAAVVINNNLADGDPTLKGLELSVEEVPRDGHDTQINETIQVNNNAPMKPIKGAGRPPRNSNN